MSLSLKKFKEFINENFPQPYSQDGTVAEPHTFTINPLGEDLEEYMFFQNLINMQDQIGKILKMNPEKVNDLLRDGHAWAVDHMATAKEDVEQVYSFLKSRVNESITEAEKKEGDAEEKPKIGDLKNSYTVDPAWWELWKQHVGEKDGYEFQEDGMTKTFIVKKDDKVIFVFDFARNKVFTNDGPSVITIPVTVDKEGVEDAEAKAAKLEDDPSDTEKTAEEE